MLLDNRSGHTFFYPPIPANELFGGLSENSRAALTSVMQSKHFGPDRQVFAAGDLPSRIYLLHRGRADVVNHKHHQISSPVCPVGPDQLFGIPEMLSERYFDMGLRTVSPCDFYLIERDDFITFLHEEPIICYRLAVMIGSLYSEALRSLKMR